MHADHGQSLNILICMAADQLIEHAEGVVVVHIRLSREMVLLDRILPVACCVLEEHDCEHHMNDYCLGRGWMEVRVVVEPSQLEKISCHQQK
jgi:hypothetical protein